MRLTKWLRTSVADALGLIGVSALVFAFAFLLLASTFGIKAACVALGILGILGAAIALVGVGEALKQERRACRRVSLGNGLVHRGGSGPGKVANKEKEGCSNL